MTKDAAGASPVDCRVRPAAWAVVAFGRVQKLVVRDDVADEVACKWREQDPRADALPLYDQSAILESVNAAVAAERAKTERMRAALAVVVADWTEQFERAGHLAPQWVKQARDALQA